MSMKHATITVVEGNNFNNQPTDHQMYAHVSEVAPSLICCNYVLKSTAVGSEFQFGPKLSRH